MAAEKITKKQLREDEFVNLFAKIVLYIQSHIKEIGMGAVILAIIAALMGGIYFYRHSFDDRAAYQLSRGLEIYHKFTPGSTPDDLKPAQEIFEGMVKQYPSSPAAEAARYYLGNCYFQMGDYDKAITAYENYLKKYSSGSFAPMAKEAQAQSWLAKKDLLKAAKEYEELIKTYDSYPMLAEVLMSLGQLYERMNNSPEALKAYQQLVQKFPDSQEKAQAQRKIDMLKKG